MNTAPMAIALRNTAAKVRQVNVSTGAEDQILRDAADLLRTLASMLEGKPTLQAFGPPGDWGYDTELGRAVLALRAAPAAAQPHVKSAAELRADALHDTSCVGAFARARP